MLKILKSKNFDYVPDENDLIKKIYMYTLICIKMKKVSFMLIYLRFYILGNST